MGVGIAFPAPFKIVSCGLINSEAKVVLVLLLRLCVHVIWCFSYVLSEMTAMRLNLQLYLALTDSNTFCDERDFMHLEVRFFLITLENFICNNIPTDAF